MIRPPPRSTRTSPLFPCPTLFRSARIRTYVGTGQSHPSWVHAARALEESNRDIYPGYGLDQWLAMAKRLYRLNSAGRVVLDYDMRIAEPLRVAGRSEEHTSELQSLMRISYAVFCLKKKKRHSETTQ